MPLTKAFTVKPLGGFTFRTTIMMDIVAEECCRLNWARYVQQYFLFFSMFLSFVDGFFSFYHQTFFDFFLESLNFLYELECYLQRTKAFSSLLDLKLNFDMTLMNTSSFDDILHFNLFLNQALKPE